jgi:succinate dehydrogenase/fumarate reductase flavoprotein subunit
MSVPWPYEVNYGKEHEICADVLVLGAGLAGCYAAIGAARKGLKVVLVDKGSTIHSGAAGSGIDHWGSCTSNPASKVTPEEFVNTAIKVGQGAYGNSIASYITNKDSYEVLLELEKMGMKIRDTDDEFEGAPFRDEKTKHLYAFDYDNKYCVRIWGTKLKKSLYKECKRLGIELYERVMVTSLLTANGKQGGRIVGATGFHNRNGEYYIFKGKASVLTMATPERIWIFSSEWAGLTGRDGPPVNSGNGHAMAWRAGGEFAMMEKSSHEEFGGSTGIGTALFGSGTTYATWYPCSVVDADGKDVPWVGADGNPITDFDERTFPKPNQSFFHLILGKGEDVPLGLPHPISDLEKRIANGEFKLPLYANLPGLPKHERRAIFGLMIGQEGKTWPIYRNYTQAGFDPDKDMLQIYPISQAPGGWRRLRYGGLMHDWNLETNLNGLFVAGQQLFDGCGSSTACCTGRWAGRHAAEYALKTSEPAIDRRQIEADKKRIYAPVGRTGGIEWKELECGVAKIMQDYCGDTKNEALLNLAKLSIQETKNGEASTLFARNPHELMRALEVLDIITCCEIIIHACLSRKSSNSWLIFDRLDYPEDDPEALRKFITVRLSEDKLKVGAVPLDYHGSLPENYDIHNKS